VETEGKRMPSVMKTRIVNATRDERDKHAYHLVIVDPEGNQSKAKILTFGSFKNEQQAMEAFAF